MASLYLVDGTYELFRAHYGNRGRTDPGGREVGATLGLMGSLLSLLGRGVSHFACAFDHTIESFRNELFDGYKTGEGIEPELLAQFELAEGAARALGCTVWPMVEFEADDAMATAAHRWGEDRSLNQVVLCSPDKDLAQCVTGQRVVCLDRRREKTLDERGVKEKFGVRPESIPDWLALVGDCADGIPGLKGWGRKSASLILARYRHLELIPTDPRAWEVNVRGAAGLARRLAVGLEQAFFYRELATLRKDVPLPEELEDLRWQGVNQEELEALCRELGETRLLERASSLEGL